MAWFEFAAAWGVFFLTHSVPIRPPMRPMLQRVLGRRGFTLAYSILSLGALIWLIGAAGRAPLVPLWDWQPWQLLVPLVVMLPVCLLLALSIGRPNPFSFGGARNDQFDPTHAGIVRLSRHPLLAALALWAGAHIVPNGDLAHVLLFGVFAGFALLGRRLIDRRKQREMGPGWHSLLTQLRASLAHATPASWSGAVMRIGLGLALYAALIWGHPWLFGVNPLG